MLEDKRQGMFLTRISEEESMKKSDQLLSEILGKKTKVPVISLKTDPRTDSLLLGQNLSEIKKSGPDGAANSLQLDAAESPGPLATKKVFVGSNLQTSNPGPATQSKPDDPISQTVNNALAKSAFKKRPEEIRTFDDSESLNNGYKQTGPESSIVPKKLTNDYSEKDLHKQMTLNSFQQEQSAFGLHAEGAKLLPQRSRTINYDDENAKKKPVHVTVSSPRVASNIPGFNDLSNRLSQTSPTDAVVKGTERPRLHQLSPERNDTISDNESPHSSFRDECPKPQPPLAAPAKPEKLGIVVYKTEDWPATSRPPDDNAKQKESQDASLVPNQDASLLNMSTGNRDLSPAPGSTAKKGILKNKQSHSHSQNLQLKKKNSVYDGAISAHSHKSRKSKMVNAPNLPTDKKVTFAPKEQVREVECWKKYNSSDFVPSEAKAPVCSKCALI